ncbi:MAG TPA: hypothetical protein VLX92_05800 [Kofleriaceae bacterium]|nr:hypothetical protein [Kofleriaceae bacterium]
MRIVHAAWVAIGCGGPPPVAPAPPATPAFTIAADHCGPIASHDVVTLTALRALVAPDEVHPALGPSSVVLVVTRGATPAMYVMTNEDGTPFQVQVALPGIAVPALHLAVGAPYHPGAGTICPCWGPTLPACYRGGDYLGVTLDATCSGSSAEPSDFDGLPVKTLVWRPGLFEPI